MLFGSQPSSALSLVALIAYRRSWPGLSLTYLISERCGLCAVASLGYCRGFGFSSTLAQLAPSPWPQLWLGPFCSALALLRILETRSGTKSVMPFAFWSNCSCPPYSLSCPVRSGKAQRLEQLHVSAWPHFFTTLARFGVSPSLLTIGRKNVA